MIVYCTSGGTENGEGTSGEYERRNSVVEVSNTDIDEEEISFSIVNPPGGFHDSRSKKQIHRTKLACLEAYLILLSSRRIF